MSDTNEKRKIVHRMLVDRGMKIKKDEKAWDVVVRYILEQDGLATAAKIKLTVSDEVINTLKETGQEAAQLLSDTKEEMLTMKKDIDALLDGVDNEGVNLPLAEIVALIGESHQGFDNGMVYSSYCTRARQLLKVLTSEQVR